ncbi:Folate transporter 3 [Richelia intracellularis]|nr:Folate transporter 3 [Richelia intracellularis]
MVAVSTDWLSKAASHGLGSRLAVTRTHWFSLGDNLVLTVMGQIAYMPVLVLAARLCPPGVEATLFALLMSVFNLAGLVSYEFGAGLMHILGISEHNFELLWLLVIITNVSTLLPLPFIKWLPSANPETGEFLPDTMSERVLQPVEETVD